MTSTTASTGTPIRALYNWHLGHTGGAHQFIQNCLTDAYGQVAVAAESAVVAATDAGDTDDDRIAAFIVETVEDMHRDAAAGLGY